MTRIIILLIVCSMLFSCSNGFHAPTDKEIKAAVIKLYEKRNEADGGGGWTIKEVEVLSGHKGNDERHYTAKVQVKGVHTSPPLANPRPDKDINETREIDLIWRDGGWIGADEQ